MLDQMIESRNHKNENNRRGGLLLGTFGVLAIVLSTGWTYSLFAKDFGLGSGDFDLSALVAPVAIPEVAPAPVPPPQPASAPASSSKTIVLKDLVTAVAPTDNPPKDLTGAKDVISADKFDLSRVKLGSTTSIPDDALVPNGRGGGGNGTTPCSGDCKGLDTNNQTAEVEKEPEVKATPKPEPKVEPKRTVSLGVINGKAEYLAKPPYPAAAKAVRATGAVNVQVLIDEQGKIVSASAVSGHPLLRAAAVDAARQSRFSPTKLSNVPVKVTGVIVFNFII